MKKFDAKLETERVIEFIRDYYFGCRSKYGRFCNFCLQRS